MWLEHELLSKSAKRLFFVSLLPIDKNPNAQREDTIIFLMFEFEMRGDINDLKKMEYELCEYLGFLRQQKKHMQTGNNTLD